MVDLREKDLRLVRFFICGALAACVSISSAAFAASSYHARPQTHFLSWESVNRPEEARRYANTHASLRRFKVSKDRIAKLKKSSFWNKRPYQFSTPLVADGKLYVGVDAGRFYAFSVPRGKKLWEFKSDGPVQGAASVGDDIVYFGDTKANVYAVDAGTGIEKWRARVDSEVLTRPLVLGARLVVADLSGRIYSLDRSNGSIVWHTDPVDRGMGFSIRHASSPVEVGGLILVGTSTGSVVAYRAADGAVSWVRQVGNRQSQIYDVDSTALLENGTAYVSSSDGIVAALDPSSGSVRWTTEAGGVNNVISMGGRIFASGEGVLSALDPSTGSISWQQDLQTPEISSPAVGDKYLAVATTKDKLFLVDNENGDILFDRFITDGALSDPVIDGDQLYLLSNTGALYSFRVRELAPRKRSEWMTEGAKKSPGHPIKPTSKPNAKHH